MPDPSPGDAPRLRADAQENYARIVAAAVRVFGREGPDAPLRTIAAEAGVGIGTLYRRFPDRDQLVEAVHRNGVLEICGQAAVLLESAQSPVDALREWMTALAELLITRRGMAAALKPVLADNIEYRRETRAQLSSAMATLLDAGQAAGLLRADFAALEVLRALAGIAYSAETIAEAQRSIMLIVDGLQFGVELPSG